MTFFILGFSIYIFGFLLFHYAIIPYINSKPGKQYNKQESFDISSMWPIALCVMFIILMVAVIYHIVILVGLPFKYIKEQFKKKNGKDLWETMNDKFKDKGK